MTTEQAITCVRLIDQGHENGLRVSVTPPDNPNTCVWVHAWDAYDRVKGVALVEGDGSITIKEGRLA